LATNEKTPLDAESGQQSAVGDQQQTEAAA
jgi:hypothetical protein